MRAGVAVIAFLAAGLPLRTAFSQEAFRGEIHGSVVRTGTQEPIAGARVYVAGLNTPSVPLFITSTDEDGRFVFRDLEENDYAVRTDRDGFYGISNGAATAYAGTGVTIAPGRPAVPLSLDLRPTGTIAGRVTTAEGRPLIGAVLSVYTATYRSGLRTFVPANPVLTSGRVLTDDRGEYRLFWLPPGEYFIRAESPAASPRVRREPARYVYYPDTQDSGRAVPIALREGDEARGIDFHIPSVSTFLVSGKVLFATAPGADGLPLRNVSFYLVPRDRSAPDRTPVFVGSSNSGRQPVEEVSFEIGIPQGTWDLYAFNRIPGGSQVVEMARIPIDSQDRSRENLVLRLLPPPSVSGRIVGDTAGMAFDTIGFRLTPREQYFTSGPTPPRFDSGGAFTFASASDLAYSVTATQLPQNSYIAGIRIGGRVADTGILEVGSGGIQDLEIRIAADGARLRGVAAAEDRQLKAELVSLVPQPPLRQSLHLYKRATVDQATGEFSMSGVAPGNYILLAWQSRPQNNAEQNSEFLARVESLGRPIRVEPGGHQDGIRLNVIPKD